MFFLSLFRLSLVLFSSFFHIKSGLWVKIRGRITGDSVQDYERKWKLKENECRFSRDLGKKAVSLRLKERKASKEKEQEKNVPIYQNQSKKPILKLKFRENERIPSFFNRPATLPKSNARHHLNYPLKHFHFVFWFFPIDSLPGFPRDQVSAPYNRTDLLPVSCNFCF